MLGVNLLHPLSIVLAGLLLGSSLIACSSHVPNHALRRNGERATSIADWPTAVESYGQLVEREPTDWRSQAALGHAALEAGDLTRARSALEIASTLQPANAMIAHDLADTLEQQEAWDDLFAYLRDRANTTSEADDPDTAREALRTALAVDADEDVKPYLQAARLAVRLGEKEEAFRALSLAWQMNPNDPEVRAALLDIGVVPGPTMRMTTGG